MKAKNLFFICVILLFSGSVLTCSNSGDQDPYIKKMEKNKGNVFHGRSYGNKFLPDTPYGYELWSEIADVSDGNKNRLIWYGPKYGGGGAFRAEWNNAKVFLGRVGLFWNAGKPYSHYNNTFCDFKFTRSENGTAGYTSYIGVYGWSKSPMIEWYIVEDWFEPGAIGPVRIGGNAEKMGEFTVDGSVYFIYKAVRPAGVGNILGVYEPFPQFFSVRQNTRQSGTISVSEHFKEWEKAGLKLGTNMYEAKFLVEAGSGSGWLDVSRLSFYQKQEK